MIRFSCCCFPQSQIYQYSSMCAIVHRMPDIDFSQYSICTIQIHHSHLSSPCAACYHSHISKHISFPIAHILHSHHSATTAAQYQHIPTHNTSPHTQTIQQWPTSTSTSTPAPANTSSAPSPPHTTPTIPIPSTSPRPTVAAVPRIGTAAGKLLLNPKMFATITIMMWRCRIVRGR